MRRTVVTAGLIALTLAICSPAVIAANRPKAKHSTQPSAPSIGVLPVISCNTTYGAGSPPSPFVARQLATTSSTRGVSFYSNGRLTVLAPSGWACSALVAADGGQKLDVYPPGKADYASQLPPKGAELVEVQGEYTGHIPGAQLVCHCSPTPPPPPRSIRMVSRDPSVRRQPAKRRPNSRRMSSRSAIRRA